MDNLKQIEEYAGLFLSVYEIACLLDLDYETLRRSIRNRSSAESQAYTRGKLNRIVEVRRRTIDFAVKGSPAAVEIAESYIIKQAKDE